MSKFTQALHKIQQNQSGRKSGLQDTVFIHNPINARIGSRSRLRRTAFYLGILRPLIMLVGLTALILIFFFGVFQGMRIEKSLEEEAAEQVILVRSEIPVVASAPEQAVQTAESLQVPPVSSADVSEASRVQTPAAASGESGGNLKTEDVDGAGPIAADTAETEPAAEAASGRFTIQVIAYSSLARAQQEADLLRAKGYQAIILPGGAFFQICINRFPTRDAALQFLNTPKNQDELRPYPGAYIRELPYE